MPASPMRIAGLLRALPLHAARGQLYLPADVLQRHGAQAADVFAGTATTELRAALAELRLRARQHLAAARELLDAAPPAVAPAFLPVALVRPAARPHGAPRLSSRSARRDVPQWRRQWMLWRAARAGLRTAF